MGFSCVGGGVERAVECLVDAYVVDEVMEVGGCVCVDVTTVSTK